MYISRQLFGVLNKIRTSPVPQLANLQNSQLSALNLVKFTKYFSIPIFILQFRDFLQKL